MTNVEQCAICLEDCESNIESVSLQNCKHTFHIHCINSWLTKKRSCPLCRSKVSLSTQSSWRTLYLTAVFVGSEMIIERAAFTCTFLNIALLTFKKAEEWNISKEYLIQKMSQFTFLGTKLPLLDLSTRTMAIVEFRNWKTMFEHLSGEPYSTSSRIQLAKDYFQSMNYFM